MQDFFEKKEIKSEIEKIPCTGPAGPVQTGPVGSAQTSLAEPFQPTLPGFFI